MTDTARKVPVSPGDGRRFAAQAHVISVKHGDSTVLLDLSRGRYYTMNQVAGDIWASLLDGMPLRDIGAAISATYATPTTRVDPDLDALIERLVALNLVVASEHDA